MYILFNHEGERIAVFNELAEAQNGLDQYNTEEGKDGFINKEDCFTACKETGELIDRFADIDSALLAIAEYEEQDRKEGTFTPNFYDVVNSNHESFLK